MRRRLITFSALALSIPGLFASNSIWTEAQYSSEQQLATGSILVANEKLGDPNFAHSVVLIVQFDEDNGAAGLILNRQTEVPVSRIFPKAKRATKDPIYMGGPVGVTGVQALLRLPEKADQAIKVVGDIYVTGAKELMEKSIASQADPSKFRLYVGYSGWAPGQLEAEIRVGAWSIISGNPRIVFDRDPQSLWLRLTQQSRMQIALARKLGSLSAPVPQ